MTGDKESLQKKKKKRSCQIFRMESEAPRSSFSISLRRSEAAGFFLGAESSFVSNLNLYCLFNQFIYLDGVLVYNPGIPGTCCVSPGWPRT